eukprot:gene2392-1744_t
MGLSLWSILFFAFCNVIYVYIQVKFHRFSVIGLVLPSIWILNDKGVTLVAKALGIPAFLCLHLWSGQRGYVPIEWTSFFGLLALSFSRLPPPAKKKMPKLNARHINVDGEEPLPTPPTSPYRLGQSVGFVLPLAEEFDRPPEPAGSPRILRSEEKVKRDRTKLEKAIADARAEERRRIAEASANLHKKQHS